VPAPLAAPSQAAEPTDLAGLYRLHARTVARWAARLGGPGIDVEDVVHEVFLVAGTRLTSYAHAAGVRTWLFKATQRITLAARRKQRLRRLLAAVPGLEVSHMGSAAPTPAQALERGRDSVLVHLVLDRLPEKQRQVLVLFELEELSTAQLAELYGVEPVTIRVWLHRARARFIREQHALVDREARRAGRKAGEGEGEPT
jgi:RNA polymerase sigma-70 factor (ECF subfamily)